MRKLFSQEEKAAVRKKRKILLTVYIIVSFLLWAGNAAIITLFALRLISKTLGMIVNIIITAVWGGGTLFFFGLLFQVVNKYYRMLKNMEKGLKDEVTLKFIRFQEELVSKDGVEFYTMIMQVKPNKLGLAEGERNILIEKTKEKPDINPGELVKVHTHANILIEYEKI